MRFAFSLLALALSFDLFGVEFHAADFERVSSAASPGIELALKREGGLLHIAVRAELLDGIAPRMELGIYAGKSLRKSLETKAFNKICSASVSIPVAEIATGDTLSALRIALFLAWPSGALGQDRWRERCLHETGAPHAQLSSDLNHWMPFDFDAYSQRVSDRRNRIVITLQQPFDGKATVVIESDDGSRVRNLIAGRDYGAGRHELVWDGLNEAGQPVLPGNYRWRAISHPGIRPEYLFSFCNDGTPPWRTGSGTDMWGPDHSVISAACSNREFTFLAGSVAESGYGIVAVDAQGVKRMQYNPIMGTGIERVFLAADDTHLYAAHDGFAWGQKVDRSKPGWKAPRKISITRFEIRSGKVVEYGKKGRFATLFSPEVGPGSEVKDYKNYHLQGFTLLNGKLYLSDFHGNRVLAIDPATAEIVSEWPVPQPRALAAGKDGLVAILKDGEFARLSSDGKLTPLKLADVAQPAGLALDAGGTLFVSDRQSHTVKVFAPDGTKLKELGKPGGAYAGAFDPQRMILPGALSVAVNGWLWITEQRNTPKRVVAWDWQKNLVVREKFGPTAYGASSAGFDTRDPTRWVGQGALWSLDFAGKSAACRSILETEAANSEAEHGGDLPKHISFHHQDGRTFLIGMGNVTTISELRADGTSKPLATIGSTHRYSFACGWHPPQPFVEAFDRAYPARKGKASEKGPSFLWTDVNGDGAMQVDEFDFSTESENFAGAYWGHDTLDLTFRIPATLKGKRVLVTLKPDGFTATGAPKYPRLNDALKTAVAVDLDRNELETAVDRFGRVICNSDPQMKAFDPGSGRTLWTYPNRWSGVHGSHNAPLPEPGVMQGTLFFLGMAPFDDHADIFMVNGNHGRFFALTSDGLYLDEMFKDVRTGGTLDAYMIGGECFGGFFGRAEKDGNYYLQSGHTDYRIFRIHGLDKLQRSAGTLQITPEQVKAAERHVVLRTAEKSVKREATARWFSAAPKIDGRDDDWGAQPSIAWDKSGRFPVKARIGHDATHLYLYYNVEDTSPWSNTGKDNTLLFKTGDSVDLQLGSDTGANARRTQPVPGDFRLLIGPFQNQPTAVLYRHRMKGEKVPVTFTSPWRSEIVDSVRILSEAKVVAQKDGGRYRIEAAIPLAALGLDSLAGKTIQGDLGALYGDDGGAVTLLRSYWSNQATNLVNDVPGEIMLTPNLWGTIHFEAPAK